MALSLLWSYNPEFGLKKMYMFFISPVTLSAFFIYCHKIWSGDFLRTVYNILIASGIVTSVFVIIYYPFRFELGIYAFDVDRWSHVIYGRFIGSVFLLYVITESFSVLPFTFNRLMSKMLPVASYPLLFSVVLLFGFTVYYTGLRFSLVVLVGVLGLMFVYFAVKRNLNIRRAVMLGTAVGVLLITFLFGDFINPHLKERYEKVAKDKIMLDAPIITRISAMEVAVEMIKAKPVFGLGLGGFKIKNFGEAAFFHKYPHNIILEILAELGTAGLLLFLWLLFFIFREAYRFHPGAVFFLLYALGLALMSKDIPSNVLFWTPGIAILFLNGETVSGEW